MADRVLVTGAAGFIGSHLVERLLARGDRVVGLDTFDPFYAREHKEHNLAVARAHAGFRLVEADCTDPVALERALGDEVFDVVVHLAARVGVRPSLGQPAAYAVTNVTGTRVTLACGRRGGASRFVLASSSSVYGNAPRIPFAEDAPPAPVSPYAATKVAAERLARADQRLYGGAVVALRLFTVYGPRQRPDLAIRKFASRMLRGEAIPVYGDGSTRRDYTWIDDILRGVLAAVDYTRAAPDGFEIVNLGGHRATTLTRLIELLADALGVTPRLDRRPPQPGDVDRTWADIAKAARLLGYAPTVTPEEGVPRFVAWLREYEEAAPHHRHRQSPARPVPTIRR